MDLYLDSRADLDNIFQNFESICLKYTIPSSVYSSSLNAYYEYKYKLSCPKKNGHYVFCVWSKDNCTCGPDTCECCTMSLRPKKLVNGLIAAIGLDLIQALILEHEQLQQVRDRETSPKIN